RVEPSHPAQRGTPPVLKPGRAPGPRSLPPGRESQPIRDQPRQIVRRAYSPVHPELIWSVGRGRNPGAVNGPPHRAGNEPRASAFDQTDFTGPRTLAGLFRREFHALTLPEQLEHRSAHGAAMEEMLDAALVADEAEALVNQEPSDRPGWHNPCPPKRRVRTPGNIPGHTLSLKRRQCREIPGRKSTDSRA